MSGEEKSETAGRSLSRGFAARFRARSYTTCALCSNASQLVSLRGRRPKERERGKNERAKAASAKHMRIGAVPSSFPPILPHSF